MTDLVEVIAKAMAGPEWDAGLLAEPLRHGIAFYPMRYYWRDKARIALVALKEEEYEVKKQPVELNWYDE